MAVEVVACGVQRSLVERRRDDHLDLPRQRDLHRFHDVLIRGLASGRTDLAVDDLVAVLARHVHHRHGAVARRLQRVHVGQAGPEQLVCPLQDIAVADDRRRTAVLPATSPAGP